MNWIQQLCKAYKNATENSPGDLQGPPEAGFTIKKIKYNVILNEQSEFISYELLNELCIVPTLPDAESRTSGIVPYPLADQLKYFVPIEKDNKRYHAYITQLTEWTEQNDAPESLRIIKRYIEKNRILQDLCGQDGFKIKFNKSQEKVDGKGPDASSFICFSILNRNGTVDRVWEQTDVKNNWRKYNVDIVAEDTQLCYAEGKVMPVIYKHPKIEGNAKLISGQDTDFPFQYKGLFTEDRSSMHISYEASTCAHNMLLWLLSKQGFRRYGMLFVAWNTTNGKPIEVPIEDNYDFGKNSLLTTSKDVPISIRNASIGNNELIANISEEQICILGMQAATNGRLSITYYQELDGNTYLSRLSQWYNTCQWLIWRCDTEKGIGEWGIHTPTPEQIGIAVLGQVNANFAKQDSKGDKPASKLMCQMRSRLLSCIMDGSPLPFDFVRNAFDKAMLPMNFTNNKDEWSEFKWRQNLAVACALIRKYQYDCTHRLLPIDLDEKCTNRDYLFGRLLAIADVVEYRACKKKNAQTNAIKYIRQYVQMPNKTWLQIYQKLIPYFRKLEDNAKFYQKLFSDVEMLFDESDRKSNKMLSFNMLLGYCAQHTKLFENTRKNNNTPKEKGTDSEQAFCLPTDRNLLYGCLLSIADVIEIHASHYTKTNTNALKMVPGLMLSPVRTWGQLHNKLIPYLQKLDLRAAKHYQYLITLVESSFTREDRESILPLHPEALHAYYCMRHALLNRFDIVKTAPTQKNMILTRDAAYGKLLSIENQIERFILNIEKTEQEDRLSNAVQLMEMLSCRPATGWQTLKQKVTPYINKAQRYHADSFISEKISEINNLEENIQMNGWDTDDPLDGSYLHSFYLRGGYDGRKGKP